MNKEELYERNMRDMIDTELSELRTDKMMVKKLALAAAVFGCVLILGHTAGAKIGDLTSYLASVFGMTKEQEVEYASYLKQNKKEMIDAVSVDNTKVSVREIYASDMVICLVEVEKPSGTLDKSYQFREQDIKLTYKDGTKDKQNLTFYSNTSDQVEILGNRALYRYCFGIGTDISNVTPANAKKFATIDGGVAFGEFVDGILLKDGNVIDTKNTTADEIYTTLTNETEDLTSGSETVVFAKALDIDSIVGIIINGNKILFDK